MSHSVTVNDTVTRVRNEADIATGDQANSIATDAQIIGWLDRAHRRLRRILAREAALELLATYATVNSPYTLPSDAYRVLAVDHVVGSDVTALRQWNFRDRGRHTDTDPPVWRVINGTITFLPAAPSGGSVKAYYVPVPTTLAAGASFEAFDGFDDYMVEYAVMKVREKQEYDVTGNLLRLQQLEREFSREGARIRAESTTIADTRSGPDEDYYNG